MPNTRKQYSAAFKAQVVLEALKETKTVAQLASEHQIHPNLLTKWKQEAIADLALVFERKNSQAKAQEARPRCGRGRPSRPGRQARSASGQLGRCQPLGLLC